MNHLTRFSALLVSMAMPFIFLSCNDNKKASEPGSAMADTTAAPVVKVNTIVTTPQLMGVIKHRVKDFASWKASYESHDSVRIANGLHNYVIGRGVDDSMMVLVAVKMDDLEKAKAFSKDPTLKERMQKGGVLGTPEISFVNVVWQDTVNVGSIPRVMTTYTVKDWETWRKVFEESRQDRLDNGIVDRQFGHEADDNHKVSTVTALTDTAKAMAHWKSDALKKRIEAAGINTELKRFMFNVVHRYR